MKWLHRWIHRRCVVEFAPGENRLSGPLKLGPNVRIKYTLPTKEGEYAIQWPVRPDVEAKSI